MQGGFDSGMNPSNSSRALQIVGNKSPRRGGANGTGLNGNG